MGYTHYWTQRRDIGKAAWADITVDLGQILKHAEHIQGIALRDGTGEGVTRPVLEPSYVAFNGAGDDSHEGFVIDRVRTLDEWQTPDRKGWSFCKTARKPYDIAVTACLCYLASVAETHSVESDGNGSDWIAGLELARQALPRFANVLDIPRPILEDDRWCAPWPQIHQPSFRFNFCVDGHAYILGPGGKSYRFDTHREAAEFAMSFTEKSGDRFRDWRTGRMVTDVAGPLFNASGMFDEARRKRLGRQQAEALRWKLERAAQEGRAIAPPALIRPGEMAAIAEPLAYRLEDLLTMPVAA